MRTVTFFHDVERIPLLQETLHDVILAFSRDPWVLRHSEATLHDLVPIGEGAVGADDWAFLSGAVAGGYCPPCGVQVGFCLLAACFAFGLCGRVFQPGTAVVHTAAFFFKHSSVENTGLVV